MQTFRKATSPDSSPGGIRRLHVRVTVVGQEKGKRVVVWTTGETCPEQKWRLFFLIPARR